MIGAQNIVALLHTLKNKNNYCFILVKHSEFPNHMTHRSFLPEKTIPGSKQAKGHNPEIPNQETRGARLALSISVHQKNKALTLKVMPIRKTSKEGKIKEVEKFYRQSLNCET